MPASRAPPRRYAAWYGPSDVIVASSGSTAAIDNLTFVTGGGSTCYANCDNSTTPPTLNVADFTCFLQQFAAGNSSANCDNSTTVPTLNVADFTCFLQAFAAGC